VGCRTAHHASDTDKINAKTNTKTRMMTKTMNTMTAKNMAAAVAEAEVREPETALKHATVPDIFAEGRSTTVHAHAPLRPAGFSRVPLRLAIFGSRGIPHTYGGAEAFLEELAPRLAARGHQVKVYCRRSLFKDRPNRYRGVDLVYLPSIETKVLGTPTHTLACMLHVLTQPVDVFLVLNIVNGFHCILPRLFGRTFAINVDGLDWKRGKWGKIARRYFYWNAKWIGKICPDGVITDAAEMQRIYRDEFSTPSARIAYGANIESSENAEIVRQYGLEPFRYYLIASRMVSENNPDLIVQAFEKLKTDKLLAVAGGVNYRSEFVRKLQQTRDPRIKFLGHVGSMAHVKELHCNAYAYVHGHSLGGTNPSLLKALGYGNCILALNTPFNREVLDDYGILFERSVDDLRHKMQSVEDDPGLAEDFRRRAPERIREAYSWDHITDQYEEFFYRLVARRAKVPAAAFAG
jgi:glycosyltransferase involved in cell wall biosynthesis